MPDTQVQTPPRRTTPEPTAGSMVFLEQLAVQASAAAEVAAAEEEEVKLLTDVVSFC